jgi:hypothetical protein
MKMSTDLKPLNEQTALTRFWGGKEKGSCIQVTQSGQGVSSFNPLGKGYVQLTRQEAGQLGEMLLKFAAGFEEVQD